jgi:hypothetical protein
MRLNFDGINFSAKTRKLQQAEEIENLSNTFFSFIVWTEIYGGKEGAGTKEWIAVLTANITLA